MWLEGDVAIVTGAASGIGKSIAENFLKEKAKVVFSDISEIDVQEYGKNARFFNCDVSKEEEIKSLIGFTIKEFGKLTIMVNNAGIVKQGMIEDFSFQDWNKLVEIDLNGCFLGCKYAIQEMQKQGSGKIINISSIAGMVGFAGTSAYCAAKAGVINLTKELAIECAPKGININAIAPGVIETNMTKEILADPDQKKVMEEQTPYKRLGKPEDIAYGAIYLASGASDFVNGHTLVIDGGWTCK